MVLVIPLNVSLSKNIFEQNLIFLNTLFECEYLNKKIQFKLSYLLEMFLNKLNLLKKSKSKFYTFLMICFSFL